jgi:CrcB protein
LAFGLPDTHFCTTSIYPSGIGIEAGMDVIRGLLWVALGSVFGGMARFLISGAVARRVGETFPWGTMTVNVSGAFAIGLLGGLASTGHGIFATQPPWLFAVTGFLGCYTTVSSFSLQTLSLARDGEMKRAASNVLLSLFLCLTAVALGFLTSSKLFA